MIATARRGLLTIERLRADVEQGILDHDIAAHVPPELFGPPTPAELAAARRANRPSVSRSRGLCRRRSVGGKARSSLDSSSAILGG
jgi:hypothetical protein